ncbi:MAG: hypothetical protein IJX43_01465 [Alphaproteobacteria bacterium]|nr:hypothetical protein [Alphaproteobacteria bacterium]
MKQWIPAQHHPQKFSIFAGPEAGMTVLKEIKLKNRRHPRDGGDPLRSG